MFVETNGVRHAEVLCNHAGLIKLTALRKLFGSKYVVINTEIVKTFKRFFFLAEGMRKNYSIEMCIVETTDDSYVIPCLINDAPKHLGLTFVSKDIDVEAFIAKQTTK